MRILTRQFQRSRSLLRECSRSGNNTTHGDWLPRIHTDRATISTNLKVATFVRCCYRQPQCPAIEQHSRATSKSTRRGDLQCSSLNRRRTAIGVFTRQFQRSRSLLRECSRSGNNTTHGDWLPRIHTDRATISTNLKVATFVRCCYRQPQCPAIEQHSRATSKSTRRGDLQCSSLNRRRTAIGVFTRQFQRSRSLLR